MNALTIRSSTVRGRGIATPLAITRTLAVCGVLIFLSACASPTGGSQPTDPTTQGSGNGTGVDICSLVPDDVLTAALGSPPSPERELLQGSGSSTCVIPGTGDPAALLQLQVGPGGRDEFERQRANKEGIADLYAPLTGIGDDAFAFGEEVTVLVGDTVAVIFLEGPAFDAVEDADRLERAKSVAAAVAEGLG